MWYSKFIKGCIIFIGAMLLSCTCLAAPNLTETYKKALECYEKQKYDEAFNLAQQGHNSGDLFCTQLLAELYEYGQGTSKNLKLAIRLHRKCAQKRLSYSEYKLGYYYGNGKGVKRNYRTAFRWYKLAADRGNSSAQYITGIYYQFGFDWLKRDDKKAFEYLLKAAQQDHHRAQYEVAMCYYKGRGTDKKFEQTLNWLDKSSKAGNIDATAQLGIIAYLAKDYKNALKYLQTASDKNHGLAMYYLGNCYIFGYGVEKNGKKALLLWERAAEKEVPEAMYNLGHNYFFGYGYAKNQTQGVYWWRKAALKGNVDAQFNLGLCLKNGWGVRANATYAKKWLQKAADQGYEKAKEELKKF